MNQEQSEACLAKARQYFRDGDLAKALKMARKAQSMGNPDAKVMVGAVESKMQGGSSQPQTSASSSSAQARTAKPSGSSSFKPNTTQARQRSANTTKTEQKAPQRPFTPKQKQMVQKVLSASTLYERLSIEKTADATVIRRAYRKLALQLHPDKNGAPRAEEAFQAINRAHEVLSDDEKRKYYDMTGSEAPNAGGGGGGFRGHGQQMHPEDIFAHFARQGGFTFRAGGPGFTFQQGNDNFFYNQRAQRRRQRQQDQDEMPNFSIMSILALMFFVTLASSLFATESMDQFSLFKPQGSYNCELNHLQYPDLKYFVHHDVCQSYHSSSAADRKRRVTLEAEVRRHALHRLDTSCVQEKRQLLEMKRSVGYYKPGTEEHIKLKEAIKDFKASSCDFRDLLKRNARYARQN
eukprot:m.37106 g.37106  ORF g.37106 m.37106 type:complete len:407 (-) comp10069_c0_seq1:928-2148(-)